MDSALLATLILIACGLVLLFVAWNVRGPSEYTLGLWQIQASIERVTYVMGEVLSPSMQEASAALAELAEAIHNLDIEDDTA